MSFSQRLQHLTTRTVRGQPVLHLLNLLLPWIVLAFALYVTLTLWQSSQKYADRELQHEFDYTLQEAMRDIELRMDAYKVMLRGLQGLFGSSDQVTRQEFRRYVEVLNLQTRYPDILAVGFSPAIPDSGRAAHIAAARKEGFPEYDLRPAEQRGLHAPILYVEPLNEANTKLLGYDAYANAASRTAMNRTLKQDRVALSGKIVPQAEGATATRSHFIMFLPVYRKHPASQEVSHRTGENFGWVHVLFVADDLLNSLSASQRGKIDLAIYDGDQVSAASLISRTRYGDGSRASTAHRLKTVRQMTIAGHTWTVEAHSLPGLESRFDRNKPRFILITGICTSLLLALLMQMLIHGRANAMRLAAEMNSELIKSEHRWKFALEGAGEGVWDWNLETGTVYLSPHLKEMFGYAAEEELGNIDWLRNHYHPEDRQRMLDARSAYVEGITSEFAIEFRIHHKNGSWKWVLMRGTIVSRDDTGKPLRMIGTVADITERYAKDESLRLSATVFDTMNEAVLVTDKENCIVSVNPSFTKITGYTLADVIGKNPSVLSDSVKRPETVKALWDALLTTGSWLGEIVNRRKSGELYIAWSSISCVRNQQGEIINYVGAFSDISERKAVEQRMQYLAHFDPLTDLPNRALFSDRLRQALASAKRNAGGVALLFIDLNKFKPVNDTLGHHIGDMLLKEVAYRLLDCIRESDTAARIGGDEFVVLLAGVDTNADAKTVAEKILQTILEPCTLDGHVIRISASIGIAIYPQDGSNDHEILSNADNAMYHAKHSGNKFIACFSEIVSEHP